MDFKTYLEEASKTDREILHDIKLLASQLKNFKDTEAIINLCNKLIMSQHGAPLPSKSERGTRNG